jgi:hypothetical protein
MLTIIVLVGRATTVLFTAVLAGLQRTITDSATATPDLRRPLTSQVTNQADLASEQGSPVQSGRPDHQHEPPAQQGRRRPLTRLTGARCP